MNFLRPRQTVQSVASELVNGLRAGTVRLDDRVDVDVVPPFQTLAAQSAVIDEIYVPKAASPEAQADESAREMSAYEIRERISRSYDGIEERSMPMLGRGIPQPDRAQRKPN